MSIGRSIRIFLATGEVTGIRHAELVNWTGQALACPRNRLEELKQWEETQRPGVYFLIGAEGPGDREVYIGEAENVLIRIHQHISAKDFWQEVILFTSKDSNLTKAHVKYLEHRLIQKSKEIGRYKILNANAPTETLLPRADRAAMEEFIDNLSVLIGALGHRIFVPLAAPIKDSNNRAETFQLVTGDVEALGTPTDEGFVVFKGSTAKSALRESMGAGNMALKTELINHGKLINDGKSLRFTENVLFGTPSQAGCIVTGTSCNGRVMWKRVSDGKTLNEIENIKSS